MSAVVSARAGVDVVLAFRRSSVGLRVPVEEAGIGVLVFDVAGLHAHENEFFRHLMSGEPERDRVRLEVFRAVHGARSLRTASGMAVRSGPVNVEVRTGLARYRVSSTFLSERATRNATHVVALVERLGEKPLTGKELGARFLLTRREIETAMLVRHGLPTREVATALGISLNTARRHVENILRKLDITSRTPAAAKISGQ